jgi:hypothetical protein
MHFVNSTVELQWKATSLRRKGGVGYLVTVRFVARPFVNHFAESSGVRDELREAEVMCLDRSE